MVGVLLPVLGIGEQPVVLYRPSVTYERDIEEDSDGEEALIQKR